MYKYKGTVDLGDGTILTNPDFDVIEVRYDTKTRMVSASISFILNEEKGYRKISEYSQELPEGVELFNGAVLNQLVLAFSVSGEIEEGNG